MPLEATMMIIDNSEYMRNGDYTPSRYDAQSDAVTTVFQTKVDSNPENTVGVMSMAGKGPEVLVTHTKDLGQILAATHATSSKIFGEPDLPTAIAIAQLALKHRQNKNLRQRILVFVGSPLAGPAADERGMVRLAKKLKKNNVAVDVVVFGDAVEDDGGAAVLRAFVEAANSGDNSHTVSVPPGPHLLSEMVLRSPVLAADAGAGIPEELRGEGAAGPSGGAGGDQFEFGVDPSLDPELAMALRMSMQEHEARRAADAPAPDAAASTAVPAAAAAAPAAAQDKAPAEPTDDEEEAMLQQALAMSQGDNDVEMAEEDVDEAAEIERAIQMSLQQEQDQQQKKS